MEQPAFLEVLVERLDLVEDDEVVGRATFGNFELCQVVSALITNSITYTYDPLYRLTSAAYSGTLTHTYAYEYDNRRPLRSHGNRTAMTDAAGTITYTYDAADRAVLSPSAPLRMNSAEG